MVFIFVFYVFFFFFTFFICKHSRFTLTFVFWYFSVFFLFSPSLCGSDAFILRCFRPLRDFFLNLCLTCYKQLVLIYFRISVVNLGEYSVCLGYRFS